MVNLKDSMVAAAAAASVVLPESRLNRESQFYREFQKVLNLDDDDPEFLETLEDLNELYEPANIKSSEDVKKMTFQMIQDHHQTVLEALSQVAENFKEIEKDSEEISNIIQELEQTVKIVQFNTSNLISQVNGLTQQKDKVELRKLIVDTFLNRFTLNEQEFQTINSSKVDPDFFTVLKKVQQICDDCKALLVIDGQHIGTEILERMSAYQETAFEKLNLWIQSESRAFTKESPVISDTLKEAIKFLRSRPILLQSCLDEIVSVRQESLLKFFMNALTKGNPTEGIPSIEESFDDPIRYVSEMLAWVHQQVESEKSLLEILFDYRRQLMHRQSLAQIQQQMQQNRRMSSLNRRSSVVVNAYESMNSNRRRSTLSQNSLGKGDSQSPIPSPIDAGSNAGGSSVGPTIETHMGNMLSKFAESFCRPLKLRIEQIAMDQLDASMLQKITDLLHFYEQLLKKVLSAEDTGLLPIFQELLQLMDRLFYEVLDENAATILRDIDVPNPETLAPLESCRYMIEEMTALLLSIESSDSKDKSVKVGKLLQATFNPVLRKLASSSEGMNKSEQAVYMTNSLNEIIEGLHELVVVESTVESLNDQLQGYQQVLIKEQCDLLLSLSGLSSVIQATETKQDNLPLSYTKGAEQNDIVQAMNAFDQFLTSSTAEASESPIIDLIISKDLRKDTKLAGFKAFLDMYKTLCEAVLNPANKYEFPSTLIKRSIPQIEALLGIYY